MINQRFFLRFLAKIAILDTFRCNYKNNHVGTRDKDRFRCGRFMSVEAMVQGMIDDLTAALVDAAKHDKGNSAAGTRVRKAMQDCKAAAQAVRVQVQSDKNA
tara:strand:+ start:633 stop:938 length:306 start_codon:yes stop_codon:yes gene_type:complete